MKYFIMFCTFLFFVFTFFVIADKNTLEEDEEIKAIYVSYIELDDYIKDKSDTVSKDNIRKILDNIKSLGFNTVILHVRPFSDSIYKSKYYPISNSILNNEGNEPSYDVLKFFIDEAHRRNIRLEAWVNPFRVSNLTDTTSLSKDSLYFKFKEDDNAKVIEGKGIYLNPASEDVQKYIVDGIIEIVQNYDVDGVHFDDYFYPDKTIDLTTFKKYQENGGKLSIEDFRYENILSLIKNVYSAIKNVDKNVVFGVAPEGNIENNYNNSYLKLSTLLSSDGYVDYIMPQIYFGFENETKPYIETLNEWGNLIKVNSIKLMPALAFYKVGNYDTYALSGKDEWVLNNDIIKKQILIARNNDKYGGFSLFRYDNIFGSDKKNANTDNEIKNMLDILD